MPKTAKEIEEKKIEASESDNGGVVIEPEYELTFLEISKDNKHHFLDVPNRRLVRPSQVMSILSDLTAGIAFFPTFILEKIDGEDFYIIDGGHRFDGIDQWINMNNKNKITIPTQIYKPMTDEQRRVIYNKYNIPLRQTRDDYLYTYRDTIEIMQNLVTALPVSIYGKEQENMKVAHVCGAYLTAIEKGDFSGGFSQQPKEFTEAIQSLNDEDLDNIQIFWDILCSAFGIRAGDPLRPHYVTRTSTFYSLFRLYMQNKDRFSRQQIVDRFEILKSKTLNGQPLLVEWGKRSGKGQCRQAFNDIKSRINRGYPASQRMLDA